MTSNRLDNLMKSVREEVNQHRATEGLPPMKPATSPESPASASPSSGELLEPLRGDGEVERVLGRIRDELAQRRDEMSVGQTDVTTTPTGSPGPSVGRMELPRVGVPPNPEIERRDRYTLAEFMALDGASFVRAAYLALLRRPPDAAGLEHYLRELNSGRLGKVDVLGRLRYSSEGREKGVEVQGLFLRFVGRSLFVAPVIGPVARTVYYILRAPSTAKALERLQAHVGEEAKTRSLQVNMALEATEKSLEQSSRRIDALLAKLADIGALERKLEGSSAKIEELESRQDFVAAELEDIDALERRFERASQRIDELEGHQAALATELSNRQKAGYEELRSVAAGIRNDVAGLEAEFSRKQQAGFEELRGTTGDLKRELEELRVRVEPGAGIPEDFYAPFEDRFRGTREDIMARVAVYLPVLAEAGAGTPDRPVLDLGCGRGEWLQVLRDAGFDGRGIDLNEAMVERSRALALDVSYGDALSALKSLPDASLGAVTAFHLVEHLPFGVLVALFDQALRCLKPGGIVLFETPNPENVLVGACSFYTDPTHRHPIPPEALRYLAEARGFAGARIHRLHPPSSELSEGMDQLPARVREAFLAEQDYSVIATKR